MLRTMVNEYLAKMALSLRFLPHGLKRRESIHWEYWRREGGWRGTFSTTISIGSSLGRDAAGYGP